MKIAIAGSSGLIGSALCAHWQAAGHQVIRLVRSKPQDRTTEFYFDYLQDIFDWSCLEDCDAIINLAGSTVACRWTPANRRLIRTSRTGSTEYLVQCIKKLANPPRCYLGASAIGYYGDGGDQILTEQSPQGDYVQLHRKPIPGEEVLGPMISEGLLAYTCGAWEAAAMPLATAGIRTAFLRFGMVLSPQGGALAKMLPIFRFGLGGPLGNGRQFVSWIHLQDAIAAIDHLIASDLDGPVNIVAPQPITNAGFTQALASAVKRPAILPAPAFALRLLYTKEMANDVLLASSRVIPKVLLDDDFTFQFPDIKPALEDLV